MAINDFYFSLDRSNADVLFNDDMQRSYYFPDPFGAYNKPVIGASKRSSGKFYFEVQFNASTYRNLKIGLCNNSMGRSEALGETANSWVFDLYGGRVQHNQQTGVALVDGLPSAAVVSGAGNPVYVESTYPVSVLGINHGTLWACVAVDLDTGKAWIAINGIWSGDPERGTWPEINTSGIIGIDLSIVCAANSQCGASPLLLNVRQEEFRWQTPLGFLPWGDPERSRVKVTVRQADVPSTINNFPLKVMLSGSSGSLAYDATLNHRALATLAGKAQRNQRVGWTELGACVRRSSQFYEVATQSYLSSEYPPPNAARTRPFFVAGRYYFEVEVITVAPQGGSTDFRFGLCTSDTDMNTIVGTAAPDKAISCSPEKGWRLTTFTGEPGCPSPYVGYIWAPTIAIAAGDRFGFVVDMDNREFYVSHNGAWINSGNPDTRANPVFTVIPEDYVYCFFVQLGALTIPAASVELVTEEYLFDYAIPRGCKVIAGVQDIHERISAKTMAGAELDIEIADWSSELADISAMATVTASSQYSGTTIPANVLDGFTPFYWQPANGNMAEWLLFDFGSGFTREPATVTIGWDYNQFGTVYQGVITATLSLSTDNVTFTVVESKKVYAPTVEFDLRDTDIPLSNYRYWKIDFTKTASSNAISVYEVTFRALDAAPAATVWVKVPTLSNAQDNDILIDFRRENYPNANIKAAGVISTLTGYNHNVNANQLIEIAGNESLSVKNSIVTPDCPDIPVEHIRAYASVPNSIVTPYSTSFLQALGAFVIIRTSVVNTTSPAIQVVHISLADSLQMMDGHDIVQPTSFTIGYMVQNERPDIVGLIEIGCLEIEAEFGIESEMEIDCLDIESTVYQIVVVEWDFNIAAIGCESLAEPWASASGLIDLNFIEVESIVSSVLEISSDIQIEVMGLEASVHDFSLVSGDWDMGFIEAKATVVSGGEAEEYLLQHIKGGPDWLPFVSA